MCRPMHLCCMKEQIVELEVQHIYKLLIGLDPKYELVHAQILGRDPQPSLRDGTVFSLPRNGKNRHVMMLVPDSTAAFADQSASTNTVMKILLMEVEEGLWCLNGSGRDHGVPPTIE